MKTIQETIPNGALQGLKVLDLTRVLAGPFCTMLLGDMGAEIIKVEEPGKGDDTRGYPPFLNGHSAYFANLNRNKKSITLDLKNPAAKKTFMQLVETVDIVIENYKPGTMDKLGLSYEKAKERNPRIIYASISGFGQYGPYKDRPGYDIIGQAMGGLMSVTGWPDSPPTRTGTAMGDILGGLNCCIGILAALRSRDATGVGQHVDVALVDSVVSSMETIIQLYLVDQRVPQRIGNRYEFIYPYDSFQAADGWVVIGVGGDEVWKRFCQATGLSVLLNDASLATNRKRVESNARLKAAVTEWTSIRKVTDIVELLLAHSVPCSPIYSVDQLTNDPHIAGAREMIVEMDHPAQGKMKVINNPIKFSDTKTTIRSTSPQLGEHTEQVMAEVLSLSAEQIEALRENGAFGKTS